MVRLGRFTRDELRLLDERSTENMLFYYEKEMLMIARGVRASTVIVRPVVNRFIEMGFLEHVLGDGSRRITLSRKGREWYGLPSS